ncbi:response regulator transcription factor [Paenibacillus radicis (ex Gao et al. 2016)]|uniref:DNA-binding response regulator n=1 Tax=Paenibacillus radicis (ex Gao et al. 2016) TaxID=1737354 RepID=A0A917LY05_9BACL|nr:response regulator transcription factor [Paenibacillus radicis (ex Gao et al. 2016)]GGG64542.1 DNA-binding response regulator [Paenibacillus radicis (ex Gao et al. 2016)]
MREQKQKKLLIIEDDESIRDLLTYALRGEGYQVIGAATGKGGLRLIGQMEPDALLLDAMLPDMDGFDICREVSEKYAIPILMLTARTDTIDKIVALELGADDYMTKPFELREVSARIKALLRRKEKAANRSGNQRAQLPEGVELDKKAYAVYKHGQEIKLKPKEFELLLLFHEYPGRVFSREEIVDHVWEMDYDGDLRTVDVHVQRIRKKLNAALIETVFGVGYRMSERGAG